MATGKFIVIAGLDRDKPPYNQCQILDEDAIYPAIYKRVYGLTSRNECKKFVQNSCGAAEDKKG